MERERGKEKRRKRGRRRGVRGLQVRRGVLACLESAYDHKVFVTRIVRHRDDRERYCSSTQPLHTRRETHAISRCKRHIRRNASLRRIH